jgi:hypothetical protein
MMRAHLRTGYCLRVYLNGEFARRSMRCEQATPHELAPVRSRLAKSGLYDVIRVTEFFIFDPKAFVPVALVCIGLKS